MHARVTFISGGSPDRIDQGIEQFRGDVLPFVRDSGGRGAIMLVNRETGDGLGITLWDDEGTMRASADRASELRRDAASGLGASQEPRVETYEVAVLET